MKPTLTPCQVKYLSARADGLSPQQVADHFGVTVHTVKSTLMRARERLGALNTAHAVLLALRTGLLHTGP